MRGKKKARRLNAGQKASVKRQGAASQGFQAPKRVINSLASAMKSLEKAQSFLGSAGNGRKTKKKQIGRPRKDQSQTQVDG